LKLANGQKGEVIPVRANVNKGDLLHLTLL